MITIEEINDLLAEVLLERERIANEARRALDRLDGAENVLQQQRAQIIEQAKNTQEQKAE